MKPKVVQGLAKIPKRSPNARVCRVTKIVLKNSGKTQVIPITIGSPDIPKIVVPVPLAVIKELPDRRPIKKTRYHRPSEYIVFDNVLKYGVYEVANDYDMDEDDEAWLSEFNNYSTCPLSELNFERVISILDRLHETVFKTFVFNFS